jgi:hypothetical protein
MQTIKSELIRLSRPEELKSLLSSAGPCISLYFPVGRETFNPGDDERRWKQAVRQLEGEALLKDSQSKELTESLTNWEEVGGDRQGRDSTLVVFRSPEFFYRMWVPVDLAEKTVVGPQFYIRPLIPFLNYPEFYILALSQHDTRLLRCTQNSSEPVDLTGATASFDQWMNTEQMDHNRKNKASAGPSSGSSKGIMQGTSTEEEDWQQYMGHYFRQIDKALSQVLRDSKAPIILVGVEYELALYGQVTGHPHVLSEGVHGAPNGLKGGEMHARALEVLEHHRLRVIDEVIAEYNHLAGGGRATNRLKEIVTAAHDGRVLKLVLSDSTEQSGAMDEATHEVSGAAGEDGKSYELLNDAAVQTILHAGQVYVAPQKKIPNGAPCIAVFRY